MPTAAAQESLDFTRDVQSSTRQDHGFTVLSLYTGAGGLDLGFLQTGFKVLMSVEHNKWAASTYAALESRTVDDNRSVAVGDIDDNKGQIFATFPDVVIGGPPCQSFSVVGKMDPNDPRARHVRLFLDIVDRLQPLAFVMENVDALMNNNRWSALLQQLHRKAVAAGYNTSVVVLNSEYYGVPQARRRFFLIGSKTTTVKVPPETTPSKSITVREAFASLSVCGSPGNDTLCKAKIVPSLNPDLRRSPYAGILFNGPGRPLCLDAPSQTLPASMGGNATPIVDQLSLETGCENWIETYHHHLKKGGTPYEVVPDRLRRITVEEASVLQGFPLDMKWHGPVSARYQQIGNSVPPPLSKALAQEILKVLLSS